MKNPKSKEPGIANKLETVLKQPMPADESTAKSVLPSMLSPGLTVIKTLGNGLDIKKEAAEAFSLSDEKLNLILNSALDAIISIDINGDIIFWNPQAEKIFGWKREEVFGKKLSALIIPEQYRQRHNEGLDRYRKTGKGLVLNKLSELSAIRRNGEEFPIELTIMPIKQGDEEFFCAFIRDITERRLTEENIKRSEARLISAQEVAKLGSWDTNLQSFAVIWSNETYRIFDTDPQTFQASQDAFLAFVHPEDKARVETAFENSINNSSINIIDHRIITNAGIIKVVQERWQIVRDEHGKPVSAVGTCQDITENKKAEETLKKVYEEKNTILESIDDGFFTLDSHSLVTYWNRKAEILLGETRESVIGRNLHEMFSKPDSRVFYDNYQKAIREKSTVHFEGFSTRANKWFAVSAFASDNGLSVYFKDITEGKIAAEKIEESEIRYRSLIEQATDTICILDASGKFIEMNPSGCRMFGYSKEEILQLFLTDVFFEEDFKNNPINIEPLKVGKTINNERRIKRKDGSSLQVELNGKMLEDGKFMIFGRDISERKNAENKIKQSEARYRLLFEQNMAGIYQTTEDGRILNCNTAFAKMLKYDSPTELLGMNTSALYFVSADRKDFASKVMSEKKIINHECVLKCKDGSARYFMKNISLQKEETTGEMFFDGIMIDITEKKQAELLLKESKDRYNLISLATNDMVWDWDLVTGNVYRNKEGWKKIFRTGGNSNEFGLMHDWESRIHPDDLYNVGKVNEEIKKAEKDFFEVECRVRRDDGSYAYIHDRGNIVRNEHGKAVRVIGATQDITERKQAEIQIAKSELRFRSMVQNSSDLICILDKKGNYLYSSPAIKKILGYEPEFMVGKNSSSFIHPDDQIIIKKELAKIDSKSYYPGVITFRFKNAQDEWIWLESKVTDMSQNPDVKGYIFNSRDVTEKILAKEKLITSSKFLQQSLIEQVSLRKKAEESATKLKEAQTLAHFGHWELNFESGLTIWSDEACRIYEMVPCENSQTHESWLSFVHPEDMDFVMDIVNESKILAEDTSINHRIILKDGTVKYIVSKSRYTLDEDGKPKGLYGIVHDITEMTIAEEEINKLSIIARETVNAVVITDPEGKIIWANEAFARITEYELKEVMGKKPGDFLQGDETSAVTVRYMRNEIKKIRAFDCDIINYSKSGRKYWIRIQSQPQFDESGKLKYFFAIQTDITKEKEVEENLKASEERYRYLFDNNPANIFVWDLHSFQILEANETAMALYGYCKEELLTMTVLDLCLPEDFDTIKKYASKARQKIDFRSDIIRRHVNKAGDQMHMSIGSHRIQYKNHEAILQMATNITEKKILENELENERTLKQHEITDAVISAQEQERQEMGAELHDNINQILAGSLLYLGLAREELKIEYPYLEETVTLISSAINEIRSLSHSLIPPSLNESELLVAIEHIIKQTQKTSGIIINLHTTGFDEEAITDKLKLNIYRVIQEQFNNILKHASAQKIIISLAGKDKKTILSIKDDGIGFDKNKKANGVGLMNIKTRASLFNGEVTINSSPGKGCELKVLFDCC